MQDQIAQFIALPWVKALEPLSYLVTTLGVPWAVLVYWRDVRRQREEREVGTYSSLDDKYLHYLELCMQHPELNLFVLPTRSGGNYTAQQRIQRYALFETVISIAERAYLRYHGHSSAKRRDQWPGWEAYLRDWKAHPDFPELWAAVGGQFDAGFIAFVDTQLKPATPAPAVVLSTRAERAAAARASAASV